MKKIITLLYLVFCLNGIAQVGKEGWHWNFGKNATLDFSSGVPMAGISPLNSGEGCASISDFNTGQLLFYTDGDSVWDKNNNRMPNGIGLINGAFGTTTQGATIVPKPGSKNIYYIVTAYDEAQPNFGVYYSIVNMNLNGGLGDVSTKNVLLTAPLTTEKVVATRHCNGVDYWILTHPYNSNKYNAYLITSSGIDSIPVVSSIGTSLSTVCCGGFESAGYLKVSPNEKKIASCITNFSPNPFVEIYDFDNGTGQLSNPIKISIINSGGNYNGPYGCSFSPDNTKLYISVTGPFLNKIYQYDLSSGIPSTIISSSVTIASTSPTRLGALQIGPDAKIYVCYDGYDGTTDSIGVINLPNNIGPSCNFQSKCLTFSNGAVSLAGFPNFIDGGLNAKSINVHDIVTCNTFTNDTADAGAGFSHYNWSTGDTTQKIIINSPGTYWVQATNANGCIASDTLHAYIISPSNFNILRDTIVCSTYSNYSANAYFNGILNYHWSDGTTMPANTFTMSGTYWVDYTFTGGCVLRDSFKLILYTKPIVNLGNDVAYCNVTNPNIALNAGGNSSYTYYWSTSATTSSISISSSDVYWVKVSSSSGCFSYDTIKVIITNVNSSTLTDTTICSNSQFPIVLDATIPTDFNTNNLYYWNNGNTGPQSTVNNPGTYVASIFIQLLNNPGPGFYCESIDTFHVSVGCSDIETILFDSKQVKIYPNPNNGSFVIEPSNATKQTIQVYDVNGKLVFNQIINGKTTIDVSTLWEGVYNISLINNEYVINKRLVIVK